MAAGGFKAGKISWTGGRVDTETERSKYILGLVADKVISLGQGWSYCAPFSEPKPIAGGGGGSSHVAVLKHTDGAEMLLAYCNTSQSGIQQSAFFGNSSSGSAFAPQYQIGLCVSVSLDGSYVYSDVGGGSITIPSHASPLLGCAQYYSALSNKLSFSNKNDAAVTYSYTVVVRGETIFIISRASSWASGLITCIGAGHLIGAEAYESANAWTKCAALRLCSAADDEFDAPAGAINSESGIPFPKCKAESGNTAYAQLAINRNDAAVLAMYSGGNSTYGCVAWSTPDPMTSEMQNAAFIGRLSPIWCGIASVDPMLHGVIIGDGFKGFLDTEALSFSRHNLFTKGQTFDAGSRIYIGNGLVLGWDSLNTVNFLV